MRKPPQVEWKCSECKASGSSRLSSSGNAISLLQRIIWEHSDTSPACSGLNVTLQVPYELPSRSEVKRWEQEQWARREELRAKGLEKRRAALATKKATAGAAEHAAAATA